VFAATFAAARKMRNQTLAVFSVVSLAVILFAGWLSVGDAQEKVAEETTIECDPAANTLEVVGSNSLKFDKSAYTVPAGCLELTFGGDAGHTLVFSTPPPAPFPKFAGPGETKTYEVPAAEYTIYCDVPGHRAGGMEATITVEEAA
jgi:plastocyanin